MSPHGPSNGSWVASNGYRRNSMRSSVSIASDVEMAHDEVFSGPMSESVPSSIASFAHRRPRQDSTVTFTYLTEDEDNLEQGIEEAVVYDSELEDGVLFDDRDDLESVVSFSKRHRRSTESHVSVEHPLLDRHESTQSFLERKKAGNRISQKIYIATEDLTAVITGFCTNTYGFALYIFLCVISLGVGYLVLRWIPKWRLRLIGTPAPLKDCRWAAIEDQYGQFNVHQISKQPYGSPLSTVIDVASLGIRSENDEENDPILTHLRLLEYRYLRFVYNPVDDTFQSVSGWKDPTWTSTKLMRSGLDADERDNRELVFGQNLIDVQQKSMPQLLVDEVLHPFYIFQIASLTLWSMDQYYYYAVCIFLISIFSITATILETRSTMARLKEVSHFECNVRVLRNGFWRTVSSVDLVPGDVFEVSDPSLTQVPCDCLLLSGDCIINESMLTGESVPVSKIPVTEDVLDYLDLKAPSIHPTVAKNFLFYGTKIIRARRPRQSNDDVEAVALGIALRTGFSTTKGSLVRSMLFPKPSGFKFYRDSFRYISVMGIIALLGFTASFVNFIRLGLPWHTVVVRALDLITIVVPPALPATLTIGTNFALSRLKKQQIYCISPQRVNVGGKLDVVCFDKTGTLTEDGLDVLGLRAVNQDRSFSDMFSDPNDMVSTARSQQSPNMDYDKCRDIICTMATCHSLRVVDGELLGDPLDIKMFEFTGWTFEEGGNTQVEQQENATGDTIIPSVARPPTGSHDFQKNQVPLELGVLRSFEFVSHLRRTSVIVRQFGENGASVFVKGAPECMKEICHADSLPPDFDDLLSHYTHRGYRVIACAAKYEPKLSWRKIQKISREQAESGLSFLGFIVFENKLKDTTTPVITELREAGIRTVMCTGDNILTAISVGRECGLIDRNSPCFVPHLDSTHHLDPNASLTWESVDDPTAKLDEKTLMPVWNPTTHDVSIPLNKLNADSYSLAVSGDIFRWLIDYGTEDLIRRVLVKGQVFARMSPDEKHELVEKLQSLDYCCGFCGDGANDCGALKAADVGISLSDAEASVAAPFTSRVFDISCVPTLIKEGRAALVTSFCCFKYMSLYSAIQFTSVSFLYTSASNLGDFQYLYIDLALILPIAIFMGWNDPFPILSRKRPTADLVSRKVLTPLIGQIVLAVLTQLVVVETVRTRPWYIPPKVDVEDTNIENSENTTLFLISCFQYILSSVVLSVGPPFRQQIYKNAPFLVTLFLTLALSTFMLSETSDIIVTVMQLTPIPWSFEFFLVILAICSFAASWVAENYVFPALARIIGRAIALIRPKQEKNRRQYKVFLERMRS